MLLASAIELPLTLTAAISESKKSNYEIKCISNMVLYLTDVEICHPLIYQWIIEL